MTDNLVKIIYLANIKWIRFPENIFNTLDSCLYRRKCTCKKKCLKFQRNPIACTHINDETSVS